MNIIKLINATSELNNQSFAIDELLKKHPYFTIGHILKAKIGYQTNHLKFQESLSKAAIYSLNRTTLFQFIYRDEFFKILQYSEKTEDRKYEKIDTNDSSSSKEEIITIQNSIEELNSGISQIDEVHDKSKVETKIFSEKKEMEPERSIEIMDEANAEIIQTELENIVLEDSAEQLITRSSSDDDLKGREEVQVDLSVGHVHDDAIEKSKEAKLKPKSQAKKTSVIKSDETNSKQPAKKEIKKPESKEKLKIIESFINTNPTISRPTDQDYSETVELANKSLEDNYDFVSETLADIYLKQGNNEKAIKIFQQLILKYPEKKRYFAAQIKKLE